MKRLIHSWSANSMPRQGPMLYDHCPGTASAWEPAGLTGEHARFRHDPIACSSHYVQLQGKNVPGRHSSREGGRGAIWRSYKSH